MKKTKKMLLLVALMLGGLLFTTKVQAKMAWILENPSLICDPQVMEPGKSSTCYYFGTQNSGETYETANAGFYIMMYTTENLKLKDIAANPNLKKVGTMFVSNSGTNNTTISQAPTTMPAALKEHFKCNISTYTSKSKNKNSAGCGVFYTNTGEAAAFSSGNMKLYGYLEQHSDYVTALNISKDQAVVLGSITVELPKNNNIEGCGEVCIASFGVATEADWGHGDCTAADGSLTSEWNGDKCDTANPTSTTPEGTNKNMVDGLFNCYELTLKNPVPKKNSETGAFVSYAILAAGALIAISAVTISKKHNKLQKI